MRFQKAMGIAEECRRGQGPSDPGVLAKALVRALKTDPDPRQVVALAGRLYTVTAEAAQRCSESSHLSTAGFAAPFFINGL